jgi:hypothetical protein
VGLAPEAYDAELPHCFGRQCARAVIAAVEILAPVARYDVDVEMSCKASFPVGWDDVHRISAARKQLKLAKTKAAVTWLPALVHAPAFDGVDPATYERFVSLGYEIEEGPAHDLSCGQETVVGAIYNRASHREPVEDKRSAYGLPWERIESNDPVWTDPTPPWAGR